MDILKIYRVLIEKTKKIIINHITFNKKLMIMYYLICIICFQPQKV